jgi:glutaconyl-CoA/methylmalonyl-CoA decarboxylase subunit delta
MKININPHSIKLPKLHKEPKKIALELNPEVAAAVGLALHLYLKEAEEYEKTAATLQQMMRPFSPWSAKVYNITPPPVKIPRNR